MPQYAATLGLDAEDQRALHLRLIPKSHNDREQVGGLGANAILGVLLAT